MSTAPFNIPAIPFFRAMELSDIHTNAQQKRESTQAIASVYGKEGVFSLWLLQGYYNLVELVLNGVTPATLWWLERLTPAAQIIELPNLGH